MKAIIIIIIIVFERRDSETDLNLLLDVYAIFQTWHIYENKS